MAVSYRDEEAIKLIRNQKLHRDQHNQRQKNRICQKEMQTIQDSKILTSTSHFKKGKIIFNNQLSTKKARTTKVCGA